MLHRFCHLSNFLRLSICELSLSESVWRFPTLEINNMQKPILISGAGIASLLLAQALKRASIPCLIFERDASLSFRAQGYRLRLSPEGLDAIESVLTPEDWERFWATCGKTEGGGMGTINALSGERIKQDAPPQAQGADEELKGRNMDLGSRDGKVVGIARGEMRKIFMSGCENFVSWSRKVVGYEVSESGVRAVFADGSKSVEGEMLIGGDGIYSKIAKKVSGGRLKTYDTGARGIHGQAPSTAFKGLGEGVWRLVDDSKPGRKVFAITNVRTGDLDDPNIHFGWTMGAQPGVIRPPNDDYAIVGKNAADIAKSLTAEWHPRLRPLFDNMVEGEAAFWKIMCSTPDGVPEWPNEPRVTVIGDAAHSMTPAGGIGANTAVRDSALLGQLIAKAGGYAPDITAKYERSMRVYASEAVASSYRLGKAQFGILIGDQSPSV